MSGIARAQPRQVSVVATAALPPTLPALPPLTLNVARLLDRMVTPVNNAPAGKRHEDWTREEREEALVLAPPDASGLTAADRDAAGAAARAYEAMLAPASEERIIAWLLPFGLAVRNAQGLQETVLRAKAIAAVLPGIPAACFADDTRPLLRTGFFPSAEDVRVALEPIAAGWRAKAAALRRLAAAPAIGPSDPSPPGAGDDWDPAEVERRVAKLEAGPRDRWARMHAGLLERTMRARHPGLLPAFEARLAALRAIGPSATQAATGAPDAAPSRPKAAYLSPAALVTARAKDPLVQRARALRAEAGERASAKACTLADH